MVACQCVCDLVVSFLTAVCPLRLPICQRSISQWKFYLFIIVFHFTGTKVFSDAAELNYCPFIYRGSSNIAGHTSIRAPLLGRLCGRQGQIRMPNEPAE